MNDHPVLNSLNDAQIQAVTTTEGFVRVIAGAGTGKTRALTHRFAYLVQDIGIDPQNILCVTFTNKAAFEMRKRIKKIIGQQFTGNVCTFHGFCVGLLRKYIQKVQYPENFIIADDADIRTMLNVIYDENGISMKQCKFDEAQNLIHNFKNGNFYLPIHAKHDPIFQNCHFYYDLLFHIPADALKSLYQRSKSVKDNIIFGFLYLQRTRFALDFNDIIEFALYILETQPEIADEYQKLFEYIMVDEFQDIDKKQYRLMTILCGYHKNLFVVGDPDQTIYSWRGANIHFLIDFDKAYPNTQTIILAQNYRSSPQILGVANSLIAHNTHRIPKNLIPTRPPLANVIAHCAQHQSLEAEWIALIIQKVMKKFQYSYADFTILVRAYHLTATLEKALLQHHIPYQVQSNYPFFGRKEIKDLLSYLRMIVCQDDASFERTINIPTRGIGRQRMDFLHQAAQEAHQTLYQTLKCSLQSPLIQSSKATDYIALIDALSATYHTMPLHEILAEILEKSGYEEMIRDSGDQEKLNDIAELKNYLYDFQTSAGEDADLEHFLTHVALYSRQDPTPNADKVKIMTVHAAKGLEFPAVFVYGLNEGIFPSKNCLSPEEIEEERRLAFVAYTRAQNFLFLTASESAASSAKLYLSRFIWEIDSNQFVFFPTQPDEQIAEAKQFVASIPLSNPSSSSAFVPGDFVLHPIFGKGLILECHPQRGTYAIKFEQFETPRTISSKAKLTPAT